MTKICSKCKIEKHTSEFGKDKTHLDGLKSSCRICYSKKRRETYYKNREKIIVKQKIYRQNHKEVAKNNSLRFNYGITLEDYNKMFQEQGGCCLICGKHQSEFKKSLSVDHCHETGKIRGLLCKDCNFGIAYLKHNIKLLNSAILYLRNNE